MPATAIRSTIRVNVLQASARINPGLLETVPVVVRMLDTHGISRVHQSMLLGLSVGAVTRSLKGQLPARLNQDQITRLSLAANVHVHLHRLYSEHAASQWMTRSSRRHPFLGLSPLAYALERGIPGLLTINDLLLSDMTDYPTTTLAEREAGERFTLVIRADLDRLTRSVEGSG
ncbi:hypothetical protein [Deinococcus aquaticus]|uniref:hypothetical protein n=1 Tax=Deinococcus aquaticus TaxID=328692 RepID=UPI003F4458E0